MSPDELNLPDFDERAARRAIWLGVVRTAVTAVLFAIVGLLILQIATGFFQRRGDREERFQAVEGLGFLVANPGWKGEPSGCCNTDLTSMELFLDIWPQGANEFGERTRAWLRLDLLGRLERDSLPLLPQTPVDEALERGSPEKEATRGLLASLPEPIRATAVVELTTPLDAAGFAELLESFDVPAGAPPLRDSPPVFLQPPYPQFNQDLSFDDRGPVVKLAWPSPQIASNAVGHDGRLPVTDPLTQFEAWSRMLRDDDDGNLEKLNLPPADYIKTLAEDPKIHGFLLERTPRERLQGLLDDPRVRSVNVADVAFDLSQS